MWMLRSGELLAFPGLSERCAMFGRRTLKFYVGDCELCFAKKWSDRRTMPTSISISGAKRSHAS
jgi:hypothetical protein